MSSKRPIRSCRDPDFYYGDQMQSKHKRAKNQHYLKKYAPLLKTDFFLAQILADKFKIYNDLLDGKLLFFNTLKSKKAIVALQRTEADAQCYDQLHVTSAGFLQALKQAVVGKIYYVVTETGGRNQKDVGMNYGHSALMFLRKNPGKAGKGVKTKLQIWCLDCVLTPTPISYYSQLGVVFKRPIDAVRKNYPRLKAVYYRQEEAHSIWSCRFQVHEWTCDSFVRKKFQIIHMK
jgi:hypothetical protein